MAASGATEAARTGRGTRLRWEQIVVGVTAAGALAMLVAGGLLKEVVAGGHGQFHALFALIVLAPAIVLVRQVPAGSAATTPAVAGFTILAITQLVEGLGGFGFGPGNDVRVNALAQVHDLGLAITPLGLVAAALGVTIGVAQALRRRLGIAPALAVTVAVLGGLLVVVAKLIGM